ncbi:1,4-alpha-glucan branching enzyme, partial [Francisella tularensis subsp. holarctica]|nr:1,4-alpha-glucan branching enzyme [Francisella tularensis subsp. holarctica]
WAPNAKSICVIGYFNYLQVEDKNYMEPINDAGLWSVFIPNAKNGVKYKFVVTNKDTSHYVYKIDHYAFLSEQIPNTAS